MYLHTQFKINDFDGRFDTLKIEFIYIFHERKRIE